MKLVGQGGQLLQLSVDVVSHDFVLSRPAGQSFNGVDADMAATAADHRREGLLEGADRADLDLLLALAPDLHAGLRAESHVHLDLLGVEDPQGAVTASREEELVRYFLEAGDRISVLGNFG